jgi:hypothetical protein
MFKNLKIDCLHDVDRPISHINELLLFSYICTLLGNVNGIKKIESSYLFSNKSLLWRMKSSPMLLYITYMINTAKVIPTGSHRAENFSIAKPF